MSFIPSLCWVKRGAAKTPSKLQIEKKELEKILKTKKTKRKSKKMSKKIPTEEENDEEDHLNESDSESYQEIDIKADGMNALALYASNTDDQFLTIKDEGEDSDEEDFEIKPTDNMLVCGLIDKECCTLNAYVYNNIENCFYIHHDIILPTYPICIEWLDYDATMQETHETVNYLAIGTLNPWIEIWDLDLVDCLEPEFILGSIKKKKKKPQKEVKIKCKINGHKDALLDICWNTINRNVLSSSSADETIILWDLDELKQATKIKYPGNKVQTLKFHHIESTMLLAGSLDQTVTLYDCRDPKSNFKKWNFNAGEIEKVIWNPHSPNQFCASTDQGSIFIGDIRQDNELTTIKAHDLTVSGLIFSSKVQNLLVSTSADELVKIWDIQNDEFNLIDEKHLKIGPINCAQASPDSEFVFAFGGQEHNEPVVWDIRESQNVRDCFYPRMNIEFLKEEKEEPIVQQTTGTEDGGDAEPKKYKRSKVFKYDVNPNANKHTKRTKKFKFSNDENKKKKKFVNKKKIK